MVGENDDNENDSQRVPLALSKLTGYLSKVALKAYTVLFDSQIIVISEDLIAKLPFKCNKLKSC